jgi:hypothetical protein
MRVSSPIDDAYAIRPESGVAHESSRRWRTIRLLLCATFLLLEEITLLCYGYGQFASSAINGTITDKSAAQVPEARIFLRNIDTGIQRITSSGSAGTYSITDLSPGRYSLQVTKDGFETGEMTAILLQVNQTATLDFLLTVGSVKQTLKVSGRRIYDIGAWNGHHDKVGE